MFKNSVFKIRTKLVIIYVITFLFPILIITFSLTNQLVHFSSNNTKDLAYAGYNQLKVNFVKKFNGINSYVSDISKDSNVINYLNSQFENDYDSLNNYVNVLEKRYKVNTSYTGSILIYSDNPSLGISRMTNNSLQDFFLKYKRSEVEFGKISWSRLDGSFINDSNIGCFKAIKNINSKSDQNIIFSFETSEAELYSLFTGLLSFQSAFLLDDKNYIVTSTNRDLISKPLDMLGLDSKKPLVDMKNGDTVKMGEIRYFVFFEGLGEGLSLQYSDIPNWKLLYLIPYDSMQKKLNEIWFTYLGISLLFIFLSFFAASYMSKNITTRLSVLVDKSHEVLRGNFDIAKPDRIMDEIGTLDSSMYAMVSHLDKMMKDNNIAHNKMIEQTRITQKLENGKKEAELNALRGQINPHFLFNTLESIRMNLVLKGDKETADMVKIFGESIRMVIENTKENHTLESELEFVLYCFKIQKYRFKEKFDFEINIAENLKKYSVPKLIIQPLVENAIFHGIEKKMGQGKVSVLIEEKQGNIHIQVKDDGEGISEEILTDIKSSLANHNLKHNRNIALRNVSNRLRLLYGSQSKMSIKSVKGEGTVIDIYFPKNRR